MVATVADGVVGCPGPRSAQQLLGRSESHALRGGDKAMTRVVTVLLCRKAVETKVKVFAVDAGDEVRLLVDSNAGVAGEVVL